MTIPWYWQELLFTTSKHPKHLLSSFCVKPNSQGERGEEHSSGEGKKWKDNRWLYFLWGNNLSSWFSSGDLVIIIALVGSLWSPLYFEAVRLLFLTSGITHFKEFSNSLSCLAEWPVAQQKGGYFQTSSGYVLADSCSLQSLGDTLEMSHSGHFTDQHIAACWRKTVLLELQQNKGLSGF